MKYRYSFLFLFLLGLLSLWKFGGFSFVVSKPSEIIIFLQTFLVSDLFLHNLLKTTWRVFISCAIALILGVVMAFLKRTKWAFIYDLFYPTQFIAAAVLTLLCVVIFGLSGYIPIIVVTIVIIPNIFVATEIGINHMRTEFLEIGKLYSTDKLKTLRYIIFPQLAPYIANGFIRAHAIAWKIVITAELFVVSEGIGYLLNNYYRLMQFEKLFGVTIIIVIIGMVFDYGIRKIKEAYIRDYNPQSI